MELFKSKLSIFSRFLYSVWKESVNGYYLQGLHSNLGAIPLILPAY